MVECVSVIMCTCKSLCVRVGMHVVRVYNYIYVSVCMFIRVRVCIFVYIHSVYV